MTNNMPTSENIQIPANLFKPSEIIGILRNHLATGQVNQRVVSLRGIYFKGSYVNQCNHKTAEELVYESSLIQISKLQNHYLLNNLLSKIKKA